VSTTESEPQPPAPKTETITLRRVGNNDLYVEEGWVATVGHRHVPGETVTLAVHDDSPLTAHAARQLCGYLLYLYQEILHGRGDLPDARTAEVLLTDPDLYTPDHSVWRALPDADVVYEVPSYGWIATSRKIPLTDPAGILRLVQALASLAAQLDDASTQAAHALRAIRHAAVDVSAERPVTTDGVRPARHPLVHTATGAATRQLTDAETSAVLAEHRHDLAASTRAKAHDASDPKFRSFDLFLLQDFARFPWLLVEVHDGTHAATVFTSPAESALAFERVVADRATSRQTTVVERTAWTVWARTRTD
jgi:hypothetical protein